MPDPRFFRRAGPFSLAELAEKSGATVTAIQHANRQFSDVASLDTAGESDVSFLDNPKYRDQFMVSKAGAIIISPEFAGLAPSQACLLLTDQPYVAYAKIAACFYPEIPKQPYIAPTSVIDRSAQIGAGCDIGAHAVIGAHAEIGPDVTIEPNATIGAGVKIGRKTVIGANASLSHCLVGEECNIHPGVRIGTRGFGFASTPQGSLDVPQLGRVIIGNRVEIGANSTIDRGAGPDTVIGDGCKIDNLVQLGHNVRLGRNCIVVSQAGIAGSTVLEDFVIVAAQVGIAGHLKIGAGSMIAAQSGVMSDIAPKLKVGGSPSVPIKQFLRQAAILGKLATRGNGKS